MDDVTEKNTMYRIERSLRPTNEEWELIIKGAKLQKFKKGDYVIKEGEKSRQMYEIASGLCRIEKKGMDHILGYIGPEDRTFGEISFLEMGNATASVIADVDTSIYIIEAYFLNILFQHQPELPGRFFNYLASVLAKRVTAREEGLEERHRLLAQQLLMQQSSPSDGRLNQDPEQMIVRNYQVEEDDDEVISKIKMLQKTFSLSLPDPERISHSEEEEHEERNSDDSSSLSTSSPKSSTSSSVPEDDNTPSKLNVKTKKKLKVVNISPTLSRKKKTDEESLKSIVQTDVINLHLKPNFVPTTPSPDGTQQHQHDNQHDNIDQNHSPSSLALTAASTLSSPHSFSLESALSSTEVEELNTPNGKTSQSQPQLQHPSQPSQPSDQSPLPSEKVNADNTSSPSQPALATTTTTTTTTTTLLSEQASSKSPENHRPSKPSEITSKFKFNLQIPPSIPNFVDNNNINDVDDDHKPTTIKATSSDPTVNTTNKSITIKQQQDEKRNSLDGQSSNDDEKSDKYKIKRSNSQSKNKHIQPKKSKSKPNNSDKESHSSDKSRDPSPSGTMTKQRKSSKSSNSHAITNNEVEDQNDDKHAKKDKNAEDKKNSKSPHGSPRKTKSVDADHHDKAKIDSDAITPSKKKSFFSSPWKKSSSGNDSSPNLTKPKRNSYEIKIQHLDSFDGPDEKDISFKATSSSTASLVRSSMQIRDRKKKSRSSSGPTRTKDKISEKDKSSKKSKDNPDHFSPFKSSPNMTTISPGTTKVRTSEDKQVKTEENVDLSKSVVPTLTSSSVPKDKDKLKKMKKNSAKMRRSRTYNSLGDAKLGLGTDDDD
eukprot:TRINITY_DN3419_c1_g2_i3.p1 TRINITY_DN3419_c1_g2~~TRINITY_DN3419_c1_g2_i3.p1  ORF type:complete len:825 (+),score=329.87 TRINITY_DN3419_c1_g2_i3:3779-6253(+)